MPRWPISPTRRWGRSTQRAVAVWERAWDQFIPFLEYGPAMRKVLYTTNATESFNREMRKVLKTRTLFPGRRLGGQEALAGYPRL
jgi:transposase-like protein